MGIHHKRRHRTFLTCFFVILLVAAYVGWALLRPLGPLTATPVTLQPQPAASTLQWPGSQAAVGIVGQPVLETHGTQTPLPTASTAKVITSLVVLEAKPLQPGQPGPTLTITDADVALYNKYAAEDGSLVKVQAGEQISEYQALQTLMLPSANNMADSLAIWTFGSLPAYKTAAAAYLTKHNIITTTIGSDASGFDPSTTSTAHDLVALGELAMQNPVLAQIVGQKAADGIPVAGTVQNVNFLLGTDNIIGLKTGNTDQAGGVYISASTATVDGKPLTIVTAVMGAPNLTSALMTSQPLIQSAQTNFQPVTAVNLGTVVGKYTAPWGASVAAVSQVYTPQSNWKGSPLAATVKLDKISADATPSRTVGHIVVPASGILPQQSIPVKLQKPVPPPTFKWRLTHPTK